LISYVLRRLCGLPVIVLLVALILLSPMWQPPVEPSAKTHVPQTNRLLLLPDEEAELVERAIRVRGLDRLWFVQSLDWLGLFVAGDRGYSAYWRQPTLTGALQRRSTTARLVLASTVCCTVLSPVLGNVAEWCRDMIPDRLMRTSAYLGRGTQSLVLGLILTSVSYA
jgi:ABC-type dipeptide/oligopeptide/nickel transport system permease component